MHETSPTSHRGHWLRSRKSRSTVAPLLILAGCLSLPATGRADDNWALFQYNSSLRSLRVELAAAASLREELANFHGDRAKGCGLVTQSLYHLREAKRLMLIMLDSTRKIDDVESYNNVVTNYNNVANHINLHQDFYDKNCAGR